MIQLLKNKRNEKKKGTLTTNILVFHKTKRKEGSMYQNNTVHTHFKELSLSSVIIGCKNEIIIGCKNEKG